MLNDHFDRGAKRPTLSAVLFGAMLVVLWIAGGASREDAVGQSLVRATAFACLAVLAVRGRPVSLNLRSPVLLICFAMMSVCAMQLVPLPYSVWHVIPGREVLSQAAVLSGQGQPWRPLSMVPGGTVNALGSLFVPLTAIVLWTGLDDRERCLSPTLLLLMIVGDATVGIVQAAGSALTNPLVTNASLTVRDVEIAGMFANRNHFALFCAMGCLLAPLWAFLEPARSRWRTPVAVGVTTLLFATILAAGSRAGFALSIIGLVLGLLIARRRISVFMGAYSGWKLSLAAGGAAIATCGLAVTAIVADRATTIRRIASLRSFDDMRWQAFPTITGMIRYYFPFGTGFGGFNSVYRMHEPDALLAPEYFNHAHNDFLEVALDGGVLGALLVVAALVWWIRATLNIRHLPSGTTAELAKLGSGLLCLIILASLFDYPARTPMIMTVIAIAAMLLTDGVPRDAPALRQ